MILIAQLIIFGSLGVFFYLLADEMFQESDISWFSQQRRKQGFERQLVESLMIISSSLKAGRNLEQSFELVSLSMPSPTCDEFRMILQERKLGVTLEKSLDNLRDRIQSEDLGLVINAINFWRETGGKLEDLFSQIVHTVSERKRIMGKVQAGTAQARLSGMVVSCLPILVLFTMFFSKNPTFTDFYQHGIGQLAILAAIGLIFLGFFMTHKLTKGILPERGIDVYRQNDPALKRRKFWLYHRISDLFVPLVRNLRDPFTDRERQRVERKLVLAGRPGEFSSDQFLVLKFLFGVAIGSVIFSIGTYLFKWAFVLALGAGLLAFLMGFRGLNFYLNNRIGARRVNIEFELPNMIDLLSLATESGLDFSQSVQKVVEKSHPSDIVSEFKIFLAELKLGKTVEEAINDMASRIQVLSFLSFASSISQAKTLGADIGPTLRSQSELMRLQRFQAVEEAANKLPILLLLPLVICIFPSLLIMILGPSALDLYTSFSQGGSLLDSVVK